MDAVCRLPKSPLAQFYFYCWQRWRHLTEHKEIQRGHNNGGGHEHTDKHGRFFCCYEKMTNNCKMVLFVDTNFLNFVLSATKC